VTLDRLMSDYQVATDTSTEELARWASQHLNVQTGLGLITDHWPGARLWPRCGDPNLTLDAILERSEVVTNGVDEGGLDDFLALAVLGRERGTRKWLFWTHAWVMRSVLEARKNQAQTFLDLEKAGDLTFVSTKQAARAAAVEIIRKVDSKGLLAKVGFDPWGSKLTRDDLSVHGISQENDQVIGIPQGQLMGAIHAVEAQLADRNFVHCSQPLMSYCVGNAKMALRGNNVLITKQASSGGKIDPLMALFDAAWVMLSEPEATSSIYNDTGARPSGFLLV
jgi:phage terminase large subunit-like protein